MPSVLAVGGGRTLEAVGQRYGVCRERIRQIEAKGFVRLHRPSILDEIPGYLEN